LAFPAAEPPSKGVRLGGRYGGGRQSEITRLSGAPTYLETTMNNAELAETLVANHNLSKADARKVVDDVMAAIVTAAVKGEEVSLSGFGKFKVKDSPAREGRNPANGETIQIAASKKLTFVPAKAVKDALNG